jgi:hypothetical protein
VADGVKDANNFFLSRHAVDFEMLLRAANPQTEQVSEQSAKLGVERIEMMPDGFVASYGANGGNLNGSRRYEFARYRATERGTSESDGESVGQ